MMLPILKKRLTPIVIQAKQSEDGKIKDEPVNDSADEGLKQAFVEIAQAISSGDMDAGANALRNFFDICDSYEDSEEPEGE